MPTPPVICYIADGNTPGLESRARSVARAIPANDVFVYGGDVYQDGLTAEWGGYDNAYGDNALSVSPQGQDLIVTTAWTPGNHEYHTVNATTLKPDQSNTYWTDTGAPGGARVSRSFVVVDNSKADPNAVYANPTLSSADAQKVAASQWSHLQYLDINGWRLLFIDAASSPAADEGHFPSSGDYYDAIAALVSPVEYRRLIVFCHFPRWTSSTQHVEPRANMDPLWRLIAAKATAYISGHSHVYERMNPRDIDGNVVAQRKGCVHICAGTGGAALGGISGSAYSPAAAINVRTASLFGFVKITLTDENKFTSEFISLGSDGLQTPSTFDSVTLLAEPQILAPVADIAAGGWTPHPGSVDYNAEVMSRSPVSYLKLDDVSGTTAADASGNGRTGTYAGAPTLQQAGLIPGETEHAVTFDGTDDRVDWANAVGQIQGSFTAVIICTAGATGVKRTVFGIHNATGATNKLLISTWDSTGNVNGWTLFVNAVALSGPAATPGNVYIHVVTVDGSNAVRWTVNGTVVGTHGTALPARATDDLLSIGVDWDAGPVASDLWNGKVEKPALFSGVLSDADITALYAAATTTQGGGSSSHYDKLSDDLDSTYVSGTAT